MGNIVTTVIYISDKRADLTVVQNKILAVMRSIVIWFNIVINLNLHLDSCTSEC